MPRFRYLRNILIISLLLVALFPVYDLLYIYPSYRQLLTEETEDEAVRFVRQLIHSIGVRDRMLEGNLPPHLDRDIQLFVEDRLLLKLRIFSTRGEVLYSTDLREIGSVNTKSYFQQQVAQGQIYSKTVQKDQHTAEGLLVRRDMVETYVPVMSMGEFGGAMEVYYDVTDRRANIDALNFKSAMILVLLSSCMFLLLVYSVYRARLHMQKQEKAEGDLQKAKDELELRVQDRTGQLLAANQKLSDEIAERALAQAALKTALSDAQAAKQKIDGILHSVADGLLVTDAANRVVLINQPAEQILGFQLDQAGQHRLFDLIGNENLRLAFQMALEASTPVDRFDFVVGSEMDNPRIYQARTAVLEAGDAMDGGLVVLMQDVSREREIERMKSEFLAMAAHELHTPITTIMGYTELLTSHSLDQFSPDQQQEFHGYIHTKAVSLARIVDDLLDVSRIEGGQQLKLSRQSSDLRPLLEEIVDPYRTAHPKHRFELLIHPGDTVVEIDPERFRQLLDNLLSNAVKYSPAGGEVAVEFRPGEEAYELEVVDQGIGMSDEQMAHVFEHFYRADTSTTAVAGTGLGMSVAKYIAEAHGGRIDLQSELGKGTRIRINIPIRSAGDALAENRRRAND